MRFDPSHPTSATVAVIEGSPPLRVVRLTPPGTGAVAVVLVAGPRAAEIVSACFVPRSGRRLADLPPGRIALGRWGGAEGEELIACRHAVDRVEVHPHGGRAAVDRVVHDLMELGAVECSWKDWVRASETCPIRAAARIALADAPTQRTAAILLDQFHGALRRDLERTLQLLAAGDVGGATELLTTLASRGELGRHLVRPWHVVLAGPPNVGKSSLANALVGYERSLVYDQPGTTRDVVTARTAIDGWPVELCDTAGLRISNDPLEAAGVDLTERKLQEADLVIFVLEATASLDELDERWTKTMEASQGHLVALNKIDLVDARQRSVLPSRRNLPDGRSHFTSALTRVGIDGLLRAISHALVPGPPVSEVAVPFEGHQISAIDMATESLSGGNAAAAVASLQSLLGPARLTASYS